MKKRLLKGLFLYSSTSYYLLKNPEILHPAEKRRLKLPQNNESPLPQVIAHRGGSMENPENTL